MALAFSGPIPIGYSEFLGSCFKMGHSLGAAKYSTSKKMNRDLDFSP